MASVQLPIANDADGLEKHPQRFALNRHFEDHVSAQQNRRKHEQRKGVLVSDVERLDAGGELTDRACMP